MPFYISIDRSRRAHFKNIKYFKINLFLCQEIEEIDMIFQYKMSWIGFWFLMRLRISSSVKFSSSVSILESDDYSRSFSSFLSITLLFVNIHFVQFTKKESN